MQHTLSNLKEHKEISEISNLGRLFESYVIKNNITEEYNIWHEKELIQSLIV